MTKPTTYHQIALAEADEEQGRHKESRRSDVVGAGAKYPRASGPWADPLVAALNRAPDELGYPIDAMVIDGQPGEIEASIRALEARGENAATTLPAESETLPSEPLSRLAGDLKLIASLSDRELQTEINRCKRAQMECFDGTSSYLQDLEAREHALEAELERRRNAKA